MKQFKAMVTIRNTNCATRTIQTAATAFNVIQAKELLEAQYGRGNVVMMAF